MSTNKNPAKKRKLKSSPSSTVKKRQLEVNRRFKLLRTDQRNLWNDDDSDLEPCAPKKKTTTSNKTYIVLSDSDDEKVSSKQKISFHINDENCTSDNDCKPISKCVTCLICSILTTLTPYNCCSKHLSLLIHNKNSHDCDSNQLPPRHVMIVPITDEFVQRYINPKEFNQIKTSPQQIKTTQSTRSTRKLSKKSSTTSESSDADHIQIKKFKTSTKTSHVQSEEPKNSSPNFTQSIHSSQSGKISQDTTYTVITSTSTTISSFESPNLLDTCHLQQSFDQPIVIPDSQPDTQQDNLTTTNIQTTTQPNDPWIPISNETYTAIETALHCTDPLSSEEPCEFTPATARRTPTDVMASCLPKIKLKKGRFRQGKPITEKDSPDITTSKCQSSTICQSSSTSIIITNNRPAASLETIIEDESLVIQATHQISDKSSQSCHGLSQRTDHTTEGLSDTVMSCLFAQDESSEHDIHYPPDVIVEDKTTKTEADKLLDNALSSQLTNDQSNSQESSCPLVIIEKPPKPAKRSYRMNADGSRISISKSSISTYRQSSITSLHHRSNDATSDTSSTKK